MGGKRWTAEELQRLEDLSGNYPVATIARKLGRSFDATNIKLNRLGLNGFRQNTEHLTLHLTAEILGVEWRTIKDTWTGLGLRIFRRGNFWIIDQEELLRFLKDHQEAWNASRVTDDAIFHGAEWYRRKRARDTAAKWFWSPEESGRLVHLYRQGAPLKEIAARVGRTESAVRNKIHAMHRKGFRI